MPQQTAINLEKLREHKCFAELAQGNFSSAGAHSASQSSIQDQGFQRDGQCFCVAGWHQKTTLSMTDHRPTTGDI